MTNSEDLQLNLGDIDIPLAFFGGPYSNLQATEAFAAEMKALELAPQHVICTGDTVAYCAEPFATVQLLRDWGCHVVMGNCEESLGNDKDDCGCGFRAGSSCDLNAREWFSYAQQRLHDDQRAWMRSLPKAICFQMRGLSVRVVHGAATRINRFLFASSPEESFQEEFAAVPEDVIIAGHSGIPFVRQTGNRLWHNAGVIGMPANDGTTRGWYSLVAPGEDGGLRITVRPLQYNAEKAAQTMQDQRLLPEYAQSLLSGRWPSLDVLPPAEVADAGMPLQPFSFSWKPDLSPPAPASPYRR